MPGPSYSCSVRPISVACCVTCPILPCVCACYLQQPRTQLTPIRAAALRYLYGGRRVRLLQRVLAWTFGRFLTFLSLSFLSVFLFISLYCALPSSHVLVAGKWLISCCVQSLFFLCMDNTSFIWCQRKALCRIFTVGVIFSEEMIFAKKRDVPLKIDCFYAV